MNIQPTFVNRNIDNKNPTTNINAQALIDYFLSLHPSNKLIPNSPLYILATQQYNQSIPLTKIRPEIPNWVCGKIDPDSGEIIISPINELLRTSSGFVVDPLDPTTFVEILPITGYAKDNCLNVGTPGSYGYTKCIGDESQSDIDDREVSGIDWLSSMAADNAAIGELATEQTESELATEQITSEFIDTDTMTGY